MMRKPYRSIVLLALTATMLFGEIKAAENSVQVVMAQAPDVSLTLFGGLKTYPHFVGHVDFNANDTNLDFLLDESGVIDHDDVTVRNEFRLGLRGKGTNWTFSTVLEADFDLDKNNTDRGVRSDVDQQDNLSDDDFSAVSGMTGEDFGVEKLDFTYDFTAHGTPVTLATGWNTNYLDLETGSVLYGDDHPYISLRGQIDGIKWQAMTLFIFDDVRPGIGSDLDWRAYTLKLTVPTAGMNITPFYAFSDNKARMADVHYLGLQAFGELAILVPRAEFVYAYGNQAIRTTDQTLDVRAFAGFAAVELKFSDELRPYVGGYYISGDNDGTDGTIRAFNPITNASRYTPTFGMENALIYRYVPVIGSNLYSNAPDMLGTTEGYGGVGNGSKADSPGIYSLGIGVKGRWQNLNYQTQFQQFWLAATGGIQQAYGKAKINRRFVWEYDLNFTFNFSKNFSLGNTVSLLGPGPAIQDIQNTETENFDRLAILDTVEMIWRF